jgi:hypothetical protein
MSITSSHQLGALDQTRRPHSCYVVSTQLTEISQTTNCHRVSTAVSISRLRFVSHDKCQVRLLSEQFGNHSVPASPEHGYPVSCSLSLTHVIAPFSRSHESPPWIKHDTSIWARGNSARWQPNIDVKSAMVHIVQPTAQWFVYDRRSSWCIMSFSYASYLPHVYCLGRRLVLTPLPLARAPGYPSHQIIDIVLADCVFNSIESQT